MKKSFLLKTMLLLCALVAGSSSVWADTAGFTLGSAANVPLASGDTKTTTITGSASETWNVEITGTWNSSSMQGSSPNKSWQMGKNGGAITSAIFSTSGITGTITSIVITCSSYSAKAKVNCTVGGNNFGTQAQTTPSWTTVGDVTFSGSASGAIVVTIDNSADGARAVYVKSITVTYSNGGGSEPSVSLGTTTINASEAAVSTTSIEVTYNNLTNYDADVIFYEADGTTDATYDHSWMTAEINATTKNLDYSITANTGAARTAYLKVYAVGDEGDVESSLITISQAAKSVAAPTFSLETGSYMQGTTFTITSDGNTIYYTTDGTTPTASSTEYTAPVAIAVGKGTYKAIAKDTYGNFSSVVTRTYTGIAPASLPFSWTGTSSAGKAQLAEETGVDVNLGSDYATSNAPYRLKFDGTGKYIIIYTDGKPESVNFTAKLFNEASTGSKMKVQGSADGLTFTDIEEFTIKGAANATFDFTTSNAFAATHRAVKLVMTSKDQNVAVGSISVSAAPISVTIASSGYSTLANAKALDFANATPAGLEAYVASDVSASGVTLTAIDEAPASTGVILKGTASTVYTIPVKASAAVVGTNYLQAAVTATDCDANKVYILQSGQFHKVTAASTVPAGKAYLLAEDVPASAPEFLDFIFNFGGETTGVNDVRSKTADEFATPHSALQRRGDFFDLQGRKVANPKKGLYIVNGKKVAIK